MSKPRPYLQPKINLRYHRCSHKEQEQPPLLELLELSRPLLQGLLNLGIFGTTPHIDKYLIISLGRHSRGEGLQRETTADGWEKRY